MKKKSSFLLLVLIICFGMFSITTEYWSESFLKNSVLYVPSSLRNVCFVAAYYWDGDINNMVIDIPNSVEGYSVTAIGGNAGTGTLSPFFVDMPNVSSYCAETALPDGARLVEYNFTLNIGENVKNIKSSCHEEYYHIADTNTYAKIIFTVNCSKNNKWFYSVEGKLYKKSDNSLIKEFDYAD